MKPTPRWCVIFCGLFSTAFAYSETSEQLQEEAKDRFGILQAATVAEQTTPESELGRALFWDARLSANGQIACASCHLAEDWGADHRQHSMDARDKHTSRHSQTVFNAMLQPMLRWTGDRKSGQHQAEKSLTGSMGFTRSDDVVPLLVKYGYAEQFRSIWPSEKDFVTPTHYAQAIQAYETTLKTPSAFDRYLSGEASALSAPQQQGLKLFMTRGCADCHEGVLLGGQSIQKFGVKTPYPPVTGSSKPDAGLFEVTQKDEDRDRFRVSMLRNISKTSPYFHDGSVSQLEDAVQVMAEVQLGGRFSETELAAMVGFLNALTGEIPANYSAPKLLSDDRQ